jgi:hypothetical protein
MSKTQNGGGSDYIHSFYANTVKGGPAAISQVNLDGIDKSPMFNPLSETAIIPGNVTGIVPSGLYYATQGQGPSQNGGCGCGGESLALARAQTVEYSKMFEIEPIDSNRNFVQNAYKPGNHECVCFSLTNGASPCRTVRRPNKNALSFSAPAARPQGTRPQGTRPQGK